MHKPESVDQYISQANPKAQPMLRQLRHLIKKAAPTAEEKISYSMPYYGYQGRLVYFAAFRDHISCFPMMSATVRKKYGPALKPYLHGKVTLQFPLGSKIQIQLLTNILSSRVKANTKCR